jgi:hypothetical protein
VSKDESFEVAGNQDARTEVSEFANGKQGSRWPEQNRQHDSLSEARAFLSFVHRWSGTTAAISTFPAFSHGKQLHCSFRRRCIRETPTGLTPMDESGSRITCEPISPG